MTVCKSKCKFASLQIKEKLHLKIHLTIVDNKKESEKPDSFQYIKKQNYLTVLYALDDHLV